MEIKPPTNNLYTAISRSISSASQSSLADTPPTDWKVSQLIQAIITKITDKQLFLNIQGVKANTPKPTGLELHVGDTLKLQIEQLKPMPQFRIVRLQPTPNLNVISNAAKSISPEHTSISPMLKNIGFVATRPALRPSPLSAETNMAVRNLFKQIPSVFHLKTADKIKNHLQNSGVFIENKIKNQVISAIQHAIVNKSSLENVRVNIKPQLDIDLGAQLHRLANLIRTQLTVTENNQAQSGSPSKNTATAQVPPIHTNQKPNPQHAQRIVAEQGNLQNITVRDEAMQTFLRQIESSLSHMQQTQLHNLNESQSGRPLWLMEIPIKNGQDLDLFEIKIAHDDSSQTTDENKKIWSVTLKFDLNGLGKIKAHITMQGELVSAQFYSEKPETLRLFQENFDFLRSRLKCNGLDVDKIECARAKIKPPQQTDVSSTLGENS